MVNDSNEQPSRKKTVQFDEIFNTPKELLTPSLNKITPRYKNPEERSRQSVAPFSTLLCPNYNGKIVGSIYLHYKSIYIKAA